MIWSEKANFHAKKIKIYCDASAALKISLSNNNQRPELISFPGLFFTVLGRAGEHKNKKKSCVKLKRTLLMICWLALFQAQAQKQQTTLTFLSFGMVNLANDVLELFPARQDFIQKEG